MTFNLTICPHVEEVHFTQSIITSERSLILLKIGKQEESETGLFQIEDDRMEIQHVHKSGYVITVTPCLSKKLGPLLFFASASKCKCCSSHSNPLFLPCWISSPSVAYPRVQTCHLSIEILSTHHVPESVDCSRFLNKSQSSRVCRDLSFLNNRSQSSSCKKKLRPFLLEDNGWCPSQKYRIMVPGDLWGKKFWNPWLQEVSVGLSGWGRI